MAVRPVAQAIATESGANFLSIDSTTLGCKWYGESEKYARAVFTLARKLSPCVVFIDEIDSLLSSRDDTEKSTIASVKTTLMREWDGLATGTGTGTGARVMVVGATNRPFALDEAILRRMPRRVLVDLPSEEERLGILRVSLAGVRLADGLDLANLAQKLANYSGSDLRELCREAAVSVAHERARQLDQGGPDSDGGNAPATLDQWWAQDPVALRPLTMADFDKAKERIRPSVAEDSPIRRKVLEWNESYGEGGSQAAGRKPWAHMYT